MSILAYGPKGQCIKELIYRLTGSSIEVGYELDSMTLARLMFISRGFRFIEHVFIVPLDIQKLSGEYIGGFGLMRHQVESCVGLS